MHHGQPPQKWKLSALLRIEKAGLPLPTASIDDTQSIHLLWSCDLPFQLNEFYIVAAIKNAIIVALQDMLPAQSNLNISNQIPIPGTINTATNQYVGVPSIRAPHSKKYLQESILEHLNAHRYQVLTEQAGRVLELRALFDSRWWSINNETPHHLDWLLFFGAALGPFCTVKQLNLELRALAESMENQKWLQIRSRYEKHIEAISQTSHQGFVLVDGHFQSINHSDWDDLIRGKLRVSDQEIRDLNLLQIGHGHKTSPYLQELNANWNALGQDDFLPEHAFFLQAAS